MTVRAKFKVDSIEFHLGTKEVKDSEGKSKWVPAEVRTIKMSPVYGNGDPSHENTKFWAATPSGQVHLGVVNAAAAQEFELGKEYYLDFNLASENK